MSAPCFWGEVARKKAGGSATWEWARVECVTGGYLVEGSETTVCKRGKHKGERVCSKPYTKLVVSNAEVDQAKAEFETLTGNCCDCAGVGHRPNGWSCASGTTYAQCLRCSGSGKAAQR